MEGKEASGRGAGRPGGARRRDAGGWEVGNDRCGPPVGERKGRRVEWACWAEWVGPQQEKKGRVGWVEWLAGLIRERREKFFLNSNSFE